MKESCTQQIDSYRVEQGSVLGNALKGAVAGAVGVWVMDRVDWFMFDHEDPAARHRTEQVRPGGVPPSHVAADTVAHAMDTELPPAQLHSAGLATHYMLGIGPSTLYGAFRDRLPIREAGQDHLYGLGFGLGLYLIQDQMLNRAMGLSADPRQYPWQAHARGLVAHLVLGLTVNTVLNLLDAPRPHQRGMQRNLRQTDRSGPRASFEELDETFSIRPEDPARDSGAPAFVR
jgi:hypothetical protein